MLYFVTFVQGTRLMRNLLHISPISPVGLQLIGFVVVQVLFIAMLLNPKIRSLHQDYRRKYLVEHSRG
jgi:hypothetical protein